MNEKAQQRRRQVIQWRETGKKTFKEIAQQIGISPGRAQQIYVKACSLRKRGLLEETP